MPPRKKTPAAAPKAPAKHFNFQLSLNQIAGVTLVAFCLFLWMFFIGVWAGRTIISPCPAAPAAPAALATQETPQETPQEAQLEAPVPQRVPRLEQADSPPAIYVQPRERKKRISPHEASLHQDGL
ncbi:MAG: hypothetical protein D3916_12500 [Candidatus Electrothrix sp. MAN1_4]|nr:hypothetical protein [Candidatus Electrothrix sp. MAN1_4]